MGDVEGEELRGWQDRSARMLKWAGRSWWGFLGALLAWSLPPGAEVLTFVWYMGFTVAGFVLLALFCFAMSIWREGA